MISIGFITADGVAMQTSEQSLETKTVTNEEIFVDR